MTDQTRRERLRQREIEARLTFDLMYEGASPKVRKDIDERVARANKLLKAVQVQRAPH
jgi:hypothetical protein